MTDSGQLDRLAAQRQLGAALRALQHRSGHTLRELEKRVPVSDSSLSRYFRGDAVAPWPVVVQICRALGGDPSELRALWDSADRTPQEQAPGILTPVPVDSPRPEAPVPAWRRLAGRTGRARPRVRVTATVISGALLAVGLAGYGAQLAAEPPDRTTTVAAPGKGTAHRGAAARQPVFYEAEKARRNQVVVREAAGARSGRAIARMDYPDSYVEFAVFAASAGPRAMSVRFSNGSQDSVSSRPSCASHGLSVNGTVASPVHYPHTGWENWQKTEPVTVALHAGRNTIRFSKGDLYTELDGIELA